MAQELEVNRDLINPNFNSYRLSPNLQFSTESFPICDSIEERNGERIQTLELGNNDYSYSHVAMATSLNNLYWDRGSPEKVYFVTNLGRIMGTFLKKSDNTDGFDLNRHLFTISDYHPKHSYASLSFPSSEFALILHSIRHDDETFTSSILIINRNPSESTTESWSCHLDSGLPLSSQALAAGTSFKQSSHLHLLNSIIVNSGDNGTKDSLLIHLIFGSVNENSSQTSESNKFKSRFCSILHWIVLEKSSNSSTSSWTLKLYRRLTEGGLRSDWPRYVAFEHFETKLYLVVASEGRMKVDLMIEDSIVDQSLSPEIGNSTSIQLDSSPKQENLESTNDEVSEEDSPQFVDGIEECDKDDLYSSLILSCFEEDSGRVINEFDLSSQKWLFTVANLDCRTNLPFIVLRHDVDAFVYQPVVSKNSVTEIQFSMKHVDTFDALGYIQASKTNKTFMTLSSSASLNHHQVTSFTNALIADSIRNVYLYRSDHENRNSGTQFIFNLGDNCGSIHGLYSFPLGLVGSKSVGTAFYVLSKHCLFFVKF